ncbi:class I adenylate-forming enzyme family protein [Streptomyces griseoaurantiacus]|uniref:class I adenylate-forming enzyme family protein n=1 Tax=Streptomyces griseoaurantiacus TaxID=68213 RepID=UPI0036CBB87B
MAVDSAAPDFGRWLDTALTGDDLEEEVWGHAGRAMSFGRMRKETARTREVLAAHGIGPDSTVAVQLLPSFTLLWTVFAAWSAGAQVMLMDPRLTPAETTRLLDLCEPQFHLAVEGPVPLSAPFREECEIVVLPRRSGRPAQSAHRLVQFSSGSTGLPKVIGRTGRSLLDELERFARLPDMPRHGERLLLLSSMAYSFGLIGGVLHSLRTGVSLHFSGSTQPRELLRLLAEREIHALFGVPVHFDLLSRVGRPGGLPSLRLAVSGGEPLRPEVFTRFEEAFGVRIGQAYGMTEAGIIATDLTGRAAPPAVGTPAPGMRTEVADGTLRVRLPEDPYLHADRSGRYADGWLDTHDRCRVRPEDGVLEILGRNDSTVMIGGLNVDLTEVESVVLAHPSVTDAVVVYGEAIEAHLVAEPTLAKGELLAWCRERLSPHKLPKALHFVRKLPRTANGKTVRNRELLHASRERERQVIIR